MEKGKRKCIVCGHDEFAVAELEWQAITEGHEDLEYFYRPKAYACTNCGNIQLISGKVIQ